MNIYEKERLSKDLILVIDDDKNISYSIVDCLNSAGLTNIKIVENPDLSIEDVKKYNPALVLLDLNLGSISGLDILKEIKIYNSNIYVIMITGNTSIDDAVICLKEGAFDYIVKPFDRVNLVSKVRLALEFNELSIKNIETIEHIDGFSEIITQNDKMLSIFHYLESISKTKEPILITGETGVGKELIARAIYKISELKGELVSVNIAGVDELVFSDTLFGHKKGAFTDASSDRDGLIKKAENGLLFLDEIGELNPTSQVKLLRLIQEREYFRLGDDTKRKTNAKIIVATNKNLKNEQGSFRKDLFYRLTTHSIHIPPLRERLDDITPLVNHFINISLKKTKSRKNYI